LISFFFPWCWCLSNSSSYSRAEVDRFSCIWCKKTKKSYRRICLTYTYINLLIQGPRAFLPVVQPFLHHFNSTM
jgi:hypothetical protein